MPNDRIVKGKRHRRDCDRIMRLDRKKEKKTPGLHYINKTYEIDKNSCGRRIF